MHEEKGRADADESPGPTIEDVAAALARHVATNGAVVPGVAAELAAENDWHGRLIDVLEVLTEDAQRMGYLAGGRKPDEVVTWLMTWVDSPFSIDQIRTIVGSAGWDPEPFVPVVERGLLERFVRGRDGSPRRIRGELAGGWLSDRFALADDEEIVREVQGILDEDSLPPERSRSASSDERRKGVPVAPEASRHDHDGR